VTARLTTLTGYVVLAAAFVAWSVVTSRRPSLITFPELVARAATSRAVRLLLVLAWAWLGWHLFARGNGAFE